MSKLLTQKQAKELQGLIKELKLPERIVDQLKIDVFDKAMDLEDALLAQTVLDKALAIIDRLAAGMYDE